MLFIKNINEIEEIIKTNHIKTAVIDIDNTITKSNVLELFLYIKKDMLKNNLLWYLWIIWFSISSIPFYLILDFIDRDLFQKFFYRRYRKYKLEQLENYAKILFQEKLCYKFIGFTYDLIFKLKECGINVVLLSTSIHPLVLQYSNYFGVPSVSLNVEEHNGKCKVDLSNIKNFKLMEAQKLGTGNMMAVADSKHDFSVLNYSTVPIIVSKKEKKWMSKIKKKTFISIWEA